MRLLDDFISKIEDFHSINLSEKAVYFGYFLNRVLEKSEFTSSEIDDCFEKAHLRLPANTRDLLNKKSKKPSPRLIKTKSGFKLERKEIERINQIVTGKPVVQKTNTALHSHLVDHLDEYSHEFINEAIRCYEYGLYRSALTMTWQFTLYQLYVFVQKNKLPDFNAQYLGDSGNKKQLTVKTVDDFSEIKESKFLEYCRAANIFNNNEIKILRQSLDIRNTYSHPSKIKLSEEKCSSFIIDILDNVLKKYS